MILPRGTAELCPPGRLLQQHLPDGEKELRRELVFKIDGEPLILPTGTRHNGSSWPRQVPGPRAVKTEHAGAAHDDLYRRGVWGGANGTSRPTTRKEADRVWYLIASNGRQYESERPVLRWFNRWRGGPARPTPAGAAAGWFALRAAGWRTWNRYRRG